MVRHKGARTNQHREAAYPYAVDIPIVGDGLGQNLNRICHVVLACPGGADHWGFRSRLPDGTPEDWARIGAKLAADADAFAAQFAYLNARRVR
jgi:hypothetical protein